MAKIELQPKFRLPPYLLKDMLTENDAVEIYKMKIALQNSTGLRSERLDSVSQSLWGKTRPVAKLFGTNVRTVKYIWNRKTWSHATKHLWSMESQFESPEFDQKVVVSINSFPCKSVLKRICISAGSKGWTHKEWAIETLC